MMTNREVYVCCCIDHCQGIWSNKDVGSKCRECGAEVEAIDIDALAERIKELELALLHLSNEAGGSAEMARECIGNTNANCLINRVREARALLSAQEGGEK